MIPVTTPVVLPLPEMVATLVFDELQVPEIAAVADPVIFVLPIGPLRFEFDPILIVGKEFTTITAVVELKFEQTLFTPLDTV